jgi:hypothetical protein
MPTRIHPTVVVALACLIVSACGQTKPAENTANKSAGASTSGPTWLADMRPLDMPAGTAMTPQLTRAGGGVTLSWVEQADKAATLRFAEWNDGRWSAPATAASGSNWFLSAADVPTVTHLSNGTLVANWFVATKLEEEAYDLLLSYSKDEGKTWAMPFKPPRDKSQTQHGFASIVETPDSGIGLVWLDGRDLTAHTKDPENAVMTLRFTSFDRDWKQGPDTEVNRRVCECCQTAAAVTPDGIVAAFRDRSDKEIRDIAVARLDGDAWTPGTLVHADNYETFECPVNGPALSAHGNELAVAWYTVQKDVGQAYAAFSHDAGRTWTAPVRLDGGKSLGHVDIEMLDDGSAAATWVEFANGRRLFKLRRVGPNGVASAPMDLPGQESGRVSGYPRMTRDKDTLLFTWAQGESGEEDGPQKIRGAIAKLNK